MPAVLIRVVIISGQTAAWEAALLKEDCRLFGSYEQGLVYSQEKVDSFASRQQQTQGYTP
ncbi:hypothetical protein [Endozoicomonas sp. ONNA2]|uniref:hypothetical protein n=1 Tax=Endozoicomonas sp. ONNA2 TaxID=2828741 RepID=UPI002147876B|nr:hypothetical protein [Endozoicomonas sp. ONNA2]